ncbi:flavodoxin [Lacrimispora sp.]|uniref:flavodoxin n=1 Tax=Lacrimispora sp. TaxID=2719234 RepID=UPI00346100F8
MSKTAVVFWSGTGNTEAMAAKVVEGAKEAGAEVSLFTASEFNADKMDQFDAIAFGCPSMGGEQLEEDEFEPMFSSCEAKLQGKKIALFGSYGWGDGEWMREWEETCKKDGAVFACDYVICNEAPDDDAQAQCIELGKALA